MSFVRGSTLFLGSRLLPKMLMLNISFISLFYSPFSWDVPLLSPGVKPRSPRPDDTPHEGKGGDGIGEQGNSEQKPEEHKE